MVEYETTVNTLLAGLTLTPSDGLRLNLDLAWNSADAAFESFRFLRGEAYSAARPNQSYDFTETYLNSDLDTERIEAALEMKYELKPGRWLTGSYRYVDLEDNAPYLLDVDGSIDFYSLGFGMSFG